MVDREALTQILDLARWAPSGDNAQPWRFEILDDHRVVVHGHDTRDDCVYDFAGHASHIAHGALIETAGIAASRFGLGMRWSLREPVRDRAPTYELVFTADAGRGLDPLHAFIESRVVQRRAMRTTPLDNDDRRALEAAVGAKYTLSFLGGLGERLAVARLLWDNAYLRLTCPEAFEVHRAVIEWRARYSKDRIPEEAVGVDPVTARLMQWVMSTWSRVEFFNRYLLGTVAPRIQLDVIPALACGAHVLMRSRRPMSELLDYVEAGRAIQRLWLTASARGLLLQPEMTPVIFRWYARSGTKISFTPSIDAGAMRLAAQFERLVGASADEPFAFFCRVGRSPAPRSRSLRKDLDDLMLGPR